jgi:sulfate adenylyltransferase subunit 2
MNDHLHELEQQSIYLIREAHARLSPLAMLWSLGKDSNTLLWLVRKAFGGRVPFPLILLDTGNEFPEVYAFRDRYVREWGLDHIAATCPPAEATDATLPAGGARRRAQDARLEAVARRAQVRRRAARHPPRRAADSRQGTRHEPSRRRRPLALQGAADGAVGSFRRAGARRRARARSSTARVDRARRLALRAPRVDSGVRTVLRPQRPPVSLAGRERHHVSVTSNAATIDEIIHELETTRESERAGRAMDHEREDAFERLRAAGYM